MLIDALQCGTYERETFELLRRGNLSCATVTCGFWENAIESMESLGNWRDSGAAERRPGAARGDHGGHRARRSGGPHRDLAGFQNTDCLESRIAFVELFADLGVRVMQLTYNNQNSVGGSCYEAKDSGLARFGREVVREMNRCGILIDCSHVGDRTTLDAIEASSLPIAITHANPRSLIAHQRNKPDEVIKALARRGGVIGCAIYRNITGDYYCSSVEAWCEMVARTVEIAGIDHVGIGTDYSHHVGVRELDWMRKGRWTRGANYGAGSATNAGPAPKADWCKDASALGLIPEGLRKVGFSPEEAEKISGGNWSASMARPSASAPRPATARRLPRDGERGRGPRGRSRSAAAAASGTIRRTAHAPRTPRRVLGGPLSFSRSLLRIIEKERWRVSRETLSLDAEGAGSALYRVHTPHLPLFFYVLSFAVPLEEKTDRVIGVKWDAMGVLCIGEPTEARLREMRREMPKQKTGRADADTLMWLRGNKSTRSFESAVAALAAGRQPDPAILRSTGYLSAPPPSMATASSGRCPSRRSAPRHPLGALPRADHVGLAAARIHSRPRGRAGRHRSPEAAALERDNRRYLGIGNSAGVGIVPFIARHPRIIDAWLDIHETALARLRGRALDPRGAEARLVLSLIERAIAYFDGLPEDGGRFFLSHAALSAELGHAKEEFRARLANDGTIAISAVLDWAAATLSPETQELLLTIFAETDPTLAETLQPRFTVNEEENLRPEARIAELGPALDRLYGWSAGLDVEEGARHFFWYRSHDAGEPRIAARDGIDRSRREVQMDLPCRPLRSAR